MINFYKTVVGVLYPYIKRLGCELKIDTVAAKLSCQKMLHGVILLCHLHRSNHKLHAHIPIGIWALRRLISTAPSNCNISRPTSSLQ